VAVHFPPDPCERMISGPLIIRPTSFNHFSVTISGCSGSTQKVNFAGHIVAASNVSPPANVTKRSRTGLFMKKMYGPKRSLLWTITRLWHHLDTENGEKADYSRRRQYFGIYKVRGAALYGRPHSWPPSSTQAKSLSSF